MSHTACRLNNMVVSDSCPPSNGLLDIRQSSSSLAECVPRNTENGVCSRVVGEEDIIHGVVAATARRHTVGDGARHLHHTIATKAHDMRGRCAHKKWYASFATTTPLYQPRSRRVLLAG